MTTDLEIVGDNFGDTFHLSINNRTIKGRFPSWQCPVTRFGLTIPITPIKRKNLNNNIKY
jgi:hypothetical protein